ncbi:hypothetical protein [Sporosarcina psychrophila]|uniref:Prepilin-type N-terminal cleavage/methylation domain-containing protein n=1 Tax=Sporosarcina psychrophila TaxID=1476 RepID=A0ABV2KBQ9_SPOPS
MKFIHNEKAFTLIEMMIIPNILNWKGHNRSVCERSKAVAINGKSH